MYKKCATVPMGMCIVICRWQHVTSPHHRVLLHLQLEPNEPTTTIIIIIKIKIKDNVILHSRVTNNFESDIFVPTYDMVVDAQFGPLINIIVETGVESELETHRH
jgi:hypothetical protein